ncbi:hypothetical protein [Desulfogranum mediterraneum]|uniref:hypothetical protein n=1 Tax=Desulfogranum mediterraneum TaxID=160661 RepID=UPI00048B3D44|nr:hypothetical protein [Desulfogranum mediterraneum]
MACYPEHDPILLQAKAMDHWGMINRLAQRRFSNESLAEEAALYVLNTLAAENWARLGQFRGRSSFSTFFSSVTYRLLEDFSRKKFGRIVPPKWLRAAGCFWLLLFRLLCLERFSFLEAVHIARDRLPGVRLEQLEQAAETILAEILHCGKSQQDVELREEEAGSEDQVRAGYGQLEARERQLLFSAIGKELFGETVQGEQEHALARLLGKTIVLEDEEKLLLTLCYREGLAVSKAGRMLGLNRFQAHGRMRRLLARIRRHFIDAGCEEEIRILLS